MNFGKKWLFIFMMCTPFAGFAQDTLINKLDSLTRKKDSAGQQINNINPKAYNQRTALGVKSYFVLLGSNLKQEFTKPFRKALCNDLRQDPASAGNHQPIRLPAKSTP